ncbi:hypothetical protein E2C01_075276 [Portunus trituberculatus]|uniref:Ionotropic glutamate receptor C-terminal domain-containing protein n=1 Tax=Portunus trituberculatus TaxID=210409 RepID=A0A5B7IFR4_PORTR|nr:hypothetical protein [Portunus trituberculatus]
MLSAAESTESIPESYRAHPYARLRNLTEIELMKKSTSSTWLYALRPLVSHALPQLPKTQGKRIFVVSWWVGCFILTTAYTANLIAFITIPAYPERLQTVEQLAQSPYR